MNREPFANLGDLDLKMPKFLGPIPDNPVAVTHKSPKQLRKCVYEIARMFRREFDYDFVQYGYKGDDYDPDCVAYLWHAPDNKDLTLRRRSACGVACFRLRETGHALQWIWLHPFLRNKGVLSLAWPTFVDRHPEFDVEWPMSKAMKAFLAKVNYHVG